MNIKPAHVSHAADVLEGYQLDSTRGWVMQIQIQQDGRLYHCPSLLILAQVLDLEPALVAKHYEEHYLRLDWVTQWLDRNVCQDFVLLFRQPAGLKLAVQHMRTWVQGAI